MDFYELYNAFVLQLMRIVFSHEIILYQYNNFQNSLLKQYK
jgi:hypothetical protein